MTNFQIGIDATNTEDDDTFTAILVGYINTEEQLFQELSDKLKFPDYFGFNWDALYDCLSDFHWINKKRIVLIHTTIPALEKNVLKKYLDILDAVIEEWKTGKQHSFEVVFPNSSEDIIRALRS